VFSKSNFNVSAERDNFLLEHEGLSHLLVPVKQTDTKHYRLETEPFHPGKVVVKIKYSNLNRAANYTITSYITQIVENMDSIDHRNLTNIEI